MTDVQYTTPGTPIDNQLRREQAKAVFDLIAWIRTRKTKGDRK